jgi:sirohydrochlorin ferrochelatase
VNDCASASAPNGPEHHSAESGHGSGGADRAVLLVDNGSLEPASTLQLRRIAEAVAERLRVPVHPVSLAHSDRVSAAELQGRPAELLEPALDRLLTDGMEQLAVVPLFIGPSYAITRHVPALIGSRLLRFPAARIVQAPPLFVPDETRLGAILADQVAAEVAVLEGETGERPRVAIVDHGSPSPAVTAARDAIGQQVAAALGPTAAAVSPASMERRAGAEFDFNEPSLEALLCRPNWQRGPLVVGLLFIGPGRHAGPGGDVARIVAERRPAAAVGVRFTPLLGADPRLVDVLVDRSRAAFESITAAETGGSAALPWFDDRAGDA